MTTLTLIQADSSDGINEGEVVGTEVETDCDSEVYSGLRAQDLQEAKDQLLVETADMLHIPLFTAEALLRDNGRCMIYLSLWGIIQGKRKLYSLKSFVYQYCVVWGMICVMF